MKSLINELEALENTKLECDNHIAVEKRRQVKVDITYRTTPNRNAIDVAVNDHLVAQYEDHTGEGRMRLAGFLDAIDAVCPDAEIIYYTTTEKPFAGFAK